MTKTKQIENESPDVVSKNFSIPLDDDGYVQQALALCKEHVVDPAGYAKSYRHLRSLCWEQSRLGGSKDSKDGEKDDQWTRQRKLAAYAKELEELEFQKARYARQGKTPPPEFTSKLENVQEVFANAEHAFETGRLRLYELNEEIRKEECKARSALAHSLKRCVTKLAARTGDLVADRLRFCARFPANAPDEIVSIFRTVEKIATISKGLEGGGLGGSDLVAVFQVEVGEEAWGIVMGRLGRRVCTVAAPAPAVQRPHPDPTMRAVR